ncbi:MAG: VanZ family protein [Lachnospiraceae bacterium]|nr:VanZ family protein [Lachnospiraceae bacterium]
MFSFNIRHLVDFIVLSVLYFLVFLPRWKQRGALFIKTVMYVYLAFVLFFTLMPIITSLPFVFNHPYEVHLIPFDDYVNGRGDFMRQIILNVVMTVPFGLLFPLTQKRSKRSLAITALATFLLSLTIEVLQPFINDFRSFDVTDLITNTLGGVVGYGCFAIIRPVVDRGNRKRSRKRA